MDRALRGQGSKRGSAEHEAGRVGCYTLDRKSRKFDAATFQGGDEREA